MDNVTSNWPASKVCSGCKLDKPLEDFQKDKKGKYGRVAQCKDCVAIRQGTKKRRDMRPTPPGTKRCSKCAEIKLHSEFYPDPRAADGLYSQCRICNLGYGNKEPGKYSHLHNIPPEPEGMRYCITCKHIKTLDQFGIMSKPHGVFYRRICNPCRIVGWVEDQKQRPEYYAALIPPEVRKEKSRLYHLQHREKHLEQGREWRKLNPEKSKSIIKNWRKVNHSRYKIIRLVNEERRRARLRSLPATLTAADWKRAIAHFNGQCAVCGCTPDSDNHLCADHWKPVAKGGGTTPGNIVPLCRNCNSSKHDRPALEWLLTRFEESATQVIIQKIEDYLRSQF